MSEPLQGIQLVEALNNVYRNSVERRKANTLASLTAQYAAGGQPDFAAIGEAGGDTMKLRDDQQKQQEAQVGLFAGHLASIADPVARDSVYQQNKHRLVPFAERNGLQLPANVDDSHLPELQFIAQHFGGGQQSMAPRVVGNALVGPNGQVLYQGQQAPQKSVWDSARGAWVMPPDAQAPPQDAQDGVQMDANGQQVRIGADVNAADRAMILDGNPSGQGPPLSSPPPGAGFVQVFPPKAENAPAGYQWQGGKLAFIPGGPADPATKQQGNGNDGTGADPLAGLSPANAQLVRRLAAYEIVPDQRLMGSAQGRDLVGRASMLNPTFDVRTARAGSDFVKGLASSSPTSNGGAVQAINNAFPHLARLLSTSNDSNSGLASGEGYGAMLNPLSNIYADYVSHRSGPNTWRLESQLAIQEMQKMIKGGVATEGETNDMIARLSANLAPSQRNDAIMAAAQFMADKVAGLEARRSELLGPEASARPLMSAKAKAAMDAILGGNSPDAKGISPNLVPDASDAARSSAPPGVTVWTKDANGKYVKVQP